MVVNIFVWINFLYRVVDTGGQGRGGGQRGAFYGVKILFPSKIGKH